LSRQFIADIEPYFYGRPLVYVDAGAHHGKVFAALAASSLTIREAHLIEPNPRSFAVLQERVREVTDVKFLRLHNLALGAEPGRVVMSDSDTTSRVLGGADGTEGGEGRFEVPCVPLDALARDFEQPHVSVLKLDVEGFEAAALRGAAGLLAAQAIDVILLEAGFDLGETRLSQHGALEELLRGYGYRTFRIYEQRNEWRIDSPLLRRANFAFMSEAFAARNPYRTSRDLFAARKEIEALRAAAAEARDAREAQARALAEAEAAGARARDRARAAAADAAAAETARAAAEAALVAAEAARSEDAVTIAREREARAELAAETARLRDRLDQVLAYGRRLEKRHADMLESRSWRALEPLRGAARRLRGRPTPAPFEPALGEAAGALGADWRAPGAGRGAPRPKAGWTKSGWTKAAATKAGTGKPAKGAPAAVDPYRLEDKLWGGFSTAALADLEALAEDPGVLKADRSEANWVLARWHAAHQDHARAYAHVARMREIDPGKGGTMRCLLLESDCLTRLGRAAESRELLERAIQKKPNADDLHLAMANALLPGGAEAAPARDPAADAARLDWVNRIYDRAGLSRILKRDPDGPLSIRNLAAPGAAPIPAEGRPKVSVIMPVYEAAETLPFALEGLLAQTWTNLEILVVDDCSPDDTVAVAEAFAARDPRLRVLRQTTNQGSYAARNAGLAVATGDFVTTHDADDWSHPQKIALQVAHLEAEERLAGNYSYWIRSSEALYFKGLFRPWRNLTSKNVSSILLRRAVMEELGGWVEVRVGADSDLMRRLEVLHGQKALGGLPFAGPLSISLHEERSLTRQSATHVRTVYHGVRKEFHDAGEHWRKSARRAELRIDPARAPRPFPAPGIILPAREPEARLDLLFVSDFAMSGGAYESTLNYVRAALAAGFSTGVLHWRRYDLDVTKALNAPLRALAQEGRLRIVAPGETVRTKATIVGYPPILKHKPDLFPQIATDDLIVVVNQMASRLRGGGDPQYDPRALRARLVELFGVEGTWAPISGLVSELMRADDRYPEPSATVWTPLIDTTSWCAAPIAWRGGAGVEPVLGRHGRDHYTKWPSGREALAAAYGVGAPWRVEILGGADRALDVLGAPPANWRVLPYGAMEARAFLAGLDFFLHYPHEDYIEEFGRAVLEALAAGKPAILPPVFRQTFGDAAVYAEPEGVRDAVAALWTDEAAYLAQAARGRDFVLGRSDWSRFPARLAATTGRAFATPPEPAAPAPALAETSA
jgi:FkbM family methyltransferase